MVPISVIVTAYNVEKFIDAAIRSITAQTMKDIEIVVVDDGSTDGTHQILESLSQIDNRVVWLRKENGGVSSARNMGVKAATGEYVLFLDGDDVLLPTACANYQASAMATGADIVVSDYIERDYNGGSDIHRTAGVFNNLSGSEYGKTLLQPFASVAIWNKLVRRELYIGHSISFPIGISMAEDFVTLFELSCNARNVVKLNEPTVIYHIREGSLLRTGSLHVYTITMAMEQLRLLVQKYYGGSAEMADRYHAVCHYHVMYNRILRRRSCGGVHKKIYDWYMALNFADDGQDYARYISKLTAAEKVMAYSYRRAYCAGVVMRYLLDSARFILSSIRKAQSASLASAG